MAEQSAADSTLTLDFWQQMWTNKTSGWHEENGNEQMWKHFQQIVSEAFPSKQPKDLKVFVPLCGKARDMYRLYELGFTVVGVEFAPDPIREFFEENALPDTNTEGKPYTKSSDGRIILGQGDLFSFQSENKLPFPKYDLIWDRGSFEAMNENDRGKYADFMTSLLDNSGVYLLNASDYDRKEYAGPPLAANQKEVTKYFNLLEVKHVASLDMLGEDQVAREYFMGQGITKMTASFYTMRFATERLSS